MQMNGILVSCNFSVGSALILIRVLAMDLQEFANGPAQAEIYSLEETHNIFLHFTATNKPKVAFPLEPRAGLEPQVRKSTNYHIFFCLMLK